MSIRVQGAEKDQLVASLAAIVCHDAGVEVSADNISSVVNASGNTIPAYYAPLFATYIEKAGGVSKFFGSGPSAGGAGNNNCVCISF